MDHPIGLFVLCFTEMCDRFAYFGIRANLVLFLIEKKADRCCETCTDCPSGIFAWDREKAIFFYGMF